ncbi:MAG: hypothetical protein SF028_03630 [Candidatus Sumerlaeia bacterium]|nr:hypothetical protein [Candidatus Sumerlaeia bacterium]
MRLPAAALAAAIFAAACREPAPPPPPAPTPVPTATPEPPPTPAPQRTTASGIVVDEALAGVGDPLPKGARVLAAYTIAGAEGEDPLEEGILELVLGDPLLPTVWAESLDGVRDGARRGLRVPAALLPALPSAAEFHQIDFEVSAIAE